MGAKGPTATLWKPEGERIEFPMRYDADARAYMALFGVESAEAGETSPEFDAALLQIKLPADRR